MRDIGQEQADPVALADSQVLQSLGDPDDAGGHFTVAIFAAHEVEQIGIATATGRAEEHPRHRQRGVELIPLRGMVVA